MASPKRAAVPATIFQNQPLFVPSHSNDYGGKFRRVNRICQSNEIVIVRNGQMHVFSWNHPLAKETLDSLGQVIEK